MSQTGPEQSSYVPEPLDTQAVELDANLHELLELLARQAHESWAKSRMAEGWRFGPKRDDQRKEHPCLVPYEALPESERQVDRNTAGQVLKTLLALGYRISRT